MRSENGEVETGKPEPENVETTQNEGHKRGQETHDEKTIKRK
jgi:hypothetical protein